jgi:predicted nucleic acid-binding protein
MYGDVARSVSILATRRDELNVVAQNLTEFWAVSTRPIIDNGLGLSVAERELTKLQSLFTILPDTADILPKWEQLVVKHQVLGKKAHDARLVAAMSVHNLTNLLTFNDGDFKRFTEIVVVNPRDMVDESEI